MRKGSLIAGERTWSPFREAEDRRRIEAYWQTFGYFDVEVDRPAVVFTSKRDSVHITWHVRENERYRIRSVVLEQAPPEQDEALRDMIPFARGSTDIDLERYRKVRVDMAERLRNAGYGHANVYSRTWVDRASKAIDWYYFVDAGPKTRIASIKVEGNKKIPADRIIARSGLQVGQPYHEDLRDSVVFDLIDSGSISAAFVRVDTDTKFIVPGTAPDSGGELRDEQIDAEGHLVPRKLPEDVNVIIHVVEAPNETVRVRASFEIDPARADSSLGTTFWFRNLFAPMHHLTLEGRIGYGWLLRDRLDSPGGPYGDALVRTIHSGVLGRLGDLRLSARYRGDLFPGGTYLHALSAGPGVRTTIDRGLFFDIDVLGRWEKSVDFGPFSDADRERLAIPDEDRAYGLEIDPAIVFDARDNPVEPMSGGFLSLRARVAPGGPFDTHRYVNLAPDARGFLPLTTSLSIGVRASGEWAFFVDDDDGLPLGARLFGGGPYGFRGLGRDELAPLAVRCNDSGECAEIPVGGESLVETSAELRFLPPREPYGAVIFGDFAGAGPRLDPFELGPSFAFGIGLRLRLWYLPAALDIAYRLTQEGRIQYLTDAPFFVSFRIGEAF
jgi:hypothetical protein